MKRQLTAAFLIFLLLMTMAGCSAANTVSKPDAAEDRMEERTETVEVSAEREIHNAETPVPTAVPVPVPAPVEAQAPATTEDAAALTREQAESIALQYVGLAADRAVRLRTEYETDDGIPQYEVSFYEGDWEYEFEIDAGTGTILSYDKDHKYD